MTCAAGWRLVPNAAALPGPVPDRAWSSSALLALGRGRVGRPRRRPPGLAARLAPVHGSPYTDLDRPPLVAGTPERALVVPGGLWRRIDVREETGSTNADVSDAVRRGEPEGLVVVAERQLTGRGRRDRQWVSPARAGLTLSMLLRPGPAVAPKTWGWLPLLAGVALWETVRRQAGVEAALKWPND